MLYLVKPRMPGFNPHSINKNSPYPGDPPGLTEGSELMSKITELIHLQGEFSSFDVSLIMKEFEENPFSPRVGVDGVSMRMSSRLSQRSNRTQGFVLSVTGLV